MPDQPPGMRLVHRPALPRDEDGVISEVHSPHLPHTGLEIGRRLEVGVVDPRTKTVSELSSE